MAPLATSEVVPPPLTWHVGPSSTAMANDGQGEVVCAGTASNRRREAGIGVLCDVRAPAGQGLANPPILGWTLRFRLKLGIEVPAGAS